MTEQVVELAREARRAALLTTLCSQRGLTLEQLDVLVNQGRHATDLGDIRVGELLDQALRPTRTATHPSLRPGESFESAVMRAFRMRPNSWMPSGYFVRTMGLRRWTAQRVLAELAEAGKLERRGVTSGTRYRLAESSVAGAPDTQG